MKNSRYSSHSRFERFIMKITENKVFYTISISSILLSLVYFFFRLQITISFRF